MISGGWKWIGYGADFIWPAALELLFAATLLLTLAVLVNLALRRATGALRHRVWALTMGGLLLLPLLCPLLPKLPMSLNIPIAGARPMSIPPAQASTSSVAAPWQEGPSSDIAVFPPARRLDSLPPLPSSALPHEAEVAWTDQATPSLVVEHPLESPSLLAPFCCATILLWVLGTGLGLVAMARTLWAEHRLADGGSPLHDPSWQSLIDEIRGQLGVRCTVVTGVSRQSDVPLTIGWRRPMILLPTDCSRWTVAKRWTVLVHELSHVARHDVFWQIVARLVCAAYWFHPLAWLAARQMRVERELACDDVVLRCGGRPDWYATVLLDIATAVCHRSQASAAAVAMACRNSVERRIQAILQSGLSRSPVGPRAGRLLLLGAIIVVVLTAALHPFVPPRQIMADSLKLKSSATGELHASGNEIPNEPKPDTVATTLEKAVAEATVRFFGRAESSPAPSRRAATIVGNLGNVLRDKAVALPQLKKDIHSPDGDVRTRAAILLTMMDEAADECLSELRRALHDIDKEVRYHAAFALAHMGSKAKDAVPDLRAALADSDNNVRLAAALALQAMGPAAKDAVPELRKALSDDDKAVRDRAASALASIGTAAKDAVPELRKALKDPDDLVRNSAALALSRLGPAAKDATADLRKVLSDRYWLVRSNAASALGEIGPAAGNALPDLQKLLNDHNPQVRWVAAGALGKMGPAAKDAVADLRKALADQDPTVRSVAVCSLGKVASPDETVISDLRKALHDSDKGVRAGAAWSLGQMGPAAKDAVPDVKKALDDADENARSLAASALKKIEGDGPKQSLETGRKLLTKEQVIRELEKAGAEVRFRAWNPNEVYSVEFKQKRVGDEVISWIGRLSEARVVDLAHTNVSDAGLAGLNPLSNLEWLMLTETGITDAGVKRICEHKGLWHLNLGGTKITDDAIPELAKLPRLTELMITANPRITDLSLERLTPLKSLKTLYLNGTRVTDDGLRHLKEFPNLQTIGLYITGITDEGVQRLVEIPTLRHIELNDTRITTAALDRLGTMPNLEHLEVSSNKGVSKAAVEAFRKTHPRCTVEAYGQMGP